MKKLFVLLLCAGFFTACSEDYWDDFDTDFEKTNRSAIEVLRSAKYWNDAQTYFYTEPNGKGKGISLSKAYEGILGGPIGDYDFSVIDDVIRFYVYIRTSTPFLPNYYVDNQLELIDDRTISIHYNYSGYESRIKILEYDDTKVLIERSATLERDGITYPYQITLLRKEKEENFLDDFVSMDEYHKAEEELQNRYNQ